MLATRGASVSIATLWRFSPGTGSRAKKTGHASEQDRPDVLKHREGAVTLMRTALPTMQSGL